MANEDKLLPLEHLDELKPKDVPAETPDSAASDSQEEKTPLIQKSPAPPKPAAPAQFNQKYLRADPSKGARRLTWIVLFETIFILALGGLDGFLAFYRIPSLNTTIDSLNERVKEANSKITQLNNEKDGLYSENNILKKDKMSLEKSLSTKNAEINSLKTDNDAFAKAKQELEEKTSLLDEEKTRLDKEVARLEQDFKDVVDQKAEIEKYREELEKNLNDLKREYNTFKDGIDLKNKAARAKKEELEKEYEQYGPSALKIITELNKIPTALNEGVNFKTYSQILKELEVPYEEFKITLNENTYNYLSFKLISSAYDGYKEALERWKNVLLVNPPTSDGTKWQNKILKFENPLSSNRPWTDPIQELWRDALSSIQMAGLLIQNKEVFPEKCIACDGKEKITCLKCNGSGNCFNCGGKGLVQQDKESIPCIVCGASAKCPVCLGRTTTLCKICLLKTKEPKGGVIPKTKPETPPEKTEPSKEQPPEKQPEETEPPKEQPPEKQPEDEETEPPKEEPKE